MPSAWTNVDANFPTITQGGDPREQIMQLYNYMYSLTEELKYTLQNLDTANWNNTALEKFSGTLTEQINAVGGAATRALSLIEGLQGKIESSNEQVNGLDGALKDLSAALNRLSAALVLITGDEGEITIGSSGKRVDLNGDIYINGVKQ